MDSGPAVVVVQGRILFPAMSAPGEEHPRPPWNPTCSLDAAAAHILM